MSLINTVRGEYDSIVLVISIDHKTFESRYSFIQTHNIINKLVSE